MSTPGGLRGPLVARVAPPLALVLGVAAAHLWVVAHMGAPVVEADEFGYLYGAHYLALGGPPPATPGFPAAPYYPGYSLLLVPAWWASHQSATVYRAALGVNVALACLCALALYALARRLAPGIPPVAAALAAAVVCAYPSFLLFSAIVESENLLVPATVGVCLLAGRAFERRRPHRWALLGLAAGLLYAVHPSALVFTGAVVLAGLWVARPWRQGLPVLAALGAGTIAGLAVSELLVSRVVGSGPSDTGGILHLLASRASLGGLGALGTEAAGQLTYILAATAGLFWMGAWVCVRAWRAAGRGPVSPAAGVAVLAGLASLLMLGLSALAVGGTRGRLDLPIYGRYNEGVAAPLMLLGALGAAGLAMRRAHVRDRARFEVAGASLRVGGRPVLVGAGVLACCAGGVIAVRGLSLHGVPQASNVLAVHELFSPTARSSLDLAALAGLGVAALAACFAAWRTSLVLGAALTVAFFVPATAASMADLAHQSRNVQGLLAVPRALDAGGGIRGDPGGCVAWDTSDGGSSGAAAFDFFTYRLYAPARRFVVFDSTTAARPPCAAVVSARPDLQAVYPGARELAAGQEALWVLPAGG